MESDDKQKESNVATPRHAEVTETVGWVESSRRTRSWWASKTRPTRRLGPFHTTVLVLKQENFCGTKTLLLWREDLGLAKRRTCWCAPRENDLGLVMIQREATSMPTQ